jgi:hypothetical protein
MRQALGVWGRSPRLVGPGQPGGLTPSMSNVVMVAALVGVTLVVRRTSASVSTERRRWTVAEVRRLDVLVTLLACRAYWHTAHNTDLPTPRGNGNPGCLTGWPANLPRDLCGDTSGLLSPSVGSAARWKRRRWIARGGRR